MAKFIIVPIILVISGGLGILLLSYARQKTELRRTLRATPLRRCADLSAAALPVPAKVTGEVVVAPRGPVRAPISGEKCVWYRVKVQRHGENANGPTLRTIYKTESKDPIVVTDATGTITVRLPDGELTYMDPEQAPHLVRTVNERVPNENPTDLYGIPLDPSDCRFDTPRQYQEWILPPGRPVTALGDVHRDAEDGLVMQASERRPLVLTTAAEPELDTTIRRDVRNVRAVGIIFLAFTVVVLAALIIVTVTG